MERPLPTALLALALAAGCATGPAPLAPLPGAEGREGLPAAFRRGGSPPPAAPFPAGPTRFTLAELRRRLLDLGTPALQAAAQRWREALGRTDQAALPPNPSLMVRKERLGHGPGGIEAGFTKVELAQRFELGGKRGARTERARATARVAWFELLEERRAALLAVQKQFYRILRLEQAAALAREETRLAEELAGLGRAMAKEERIDRIELNTQEVAARRAEMAVRELERRHRRACLELDGLLGAPAGTTAGVQGGWPGPARGTPVTVAGGTLADHPRRRAREAAVAAGRKSLAEADSLAWPDLELYALGLHDEFQEEDYFGLGFGLPLPLFDRNQGGRAAARAGLIRARRALAAECARLAAELAAAQSDLARARELAALYDEEILPRLEENCALVAERVARGRASRLEELRSRLLLLAARREVLTHRQEQAAARSEIDYLMAE